MSHDWSSYVASALIFSGALLLVGAAMHDIIARTVPNWVSVLLVLIGLGSRLLDKHLISGPLAAGAVFITAAFCWRFGWLGGGDVKLMGATALVVPPYSILSFLVAMSVSGSVLALIYMALGALARAKARRDSFAGHARKARPRGLLGRVARVEIRRIRRGGPLPYACAIAAGFIILII